MATKKKTKAPKRRIVRLLPLTVTMLSLLFIIKVNEVYLGSRQLREMYAVRDASAEEAKKDAAVPDAAKAGDAAKADAAPAAADGAKPAEGAKADAAPPAADAIKASESAKPDASADAKKDDAKKEGDKKDEGKHEGKDKEGKDKPPEEPKTFGTGKSTVKDIDALKARNEQPKYTQTELDLLQNLSKRRDELDRREKDLEIKTKVLDAAEKRISDKMEEMKVMQAELSKVLAQYNEKQDTQIKSLVKIYENMKPEEAAAIMNELEMPILLDVISKMSERKVALVLAGMNPKRARDVTQELADRRKRLSLNGGDKDLSAQPGTGK